MDHLSRSVEAPLSGWLMHGFWKVVVVVTECQVGTGRHSLHVGSRVTWCYLGLVGTWGQIALFEGKCPIGSSTGKASDLAQQTFPLQKPFTLSVYLLNVGMWVHKNHSFK